MAVVAPASSPNTSEPSLGHGRLAGTRGGSPRPAQDPPSPSPASWPADGTETRIRGGHRARHRRDASARSSRVRAAARDAGALARPAAPAPPVRSADPYRDVAGGLRRAALAGDEHPRVPTGDPAAAVRRDGLRRGRTARAAAALTPPRGCSGTRTSRTGPASDPIGQLLAAASRAAVTGNPGDLGLTPVARSSDLTARQPGCGGSADRPRHGGGPVALLGGIPRPAVCRGRQPLSRRVQGLAGGRAASRLAIGAFPHARGSGAFSPVLVAAYRGSRRFHDRPPSLLVCCSRPLP